MTSSWWSIEIRLHPHPDRHSSSIRVATNTKTRLGTIGKPIANYSVKVPHTVYQRLILYRLFCSLYVEQLFKSVLRYCKITYIRAYSSTINNRGEVLKSGYIPTGTAVVSVWRRILKLAWEQLVYHLRIIQWKFRILYINVWVIFYRLFCSLYVEQLLKSVLRDCKITYIRAYSYTINNRYSIAIVDKFIHTYSPLLVHRHNRIYEYPGSPFTKMV